MLDHVQESKHGASHSTEEENSEDRWNNVHRKASLEKIEMLKTVKATSPKQEKSQLPHRALWRVVDLLPVGLKTGTITPSGSRKISSRLGVGG